MGKRVICSLFYKRVDEIVSRFIMITEEIVPMFGIDSLLTCVCVDIDSWRDHAQWFGIDSLRTCVRADIDSWRDLAHCVRVEIESWQVVPGLYGSEESSFRSRVFTTLF